MNSAVSQLARSAESAIMQAIRQAKKEQDQWPNLAQLRHMTGLAPSVANSAIRRLFATGMITPTGRDAYRPVRGAQEDLPVQQLSPEELDRVRRGEISTGRPPSCTSIPTVTPGLPVPDSTLQEAGVRR